jgi:hypothetical protein
MGATHFQMKALKNVGTEMALQMRDANLRNGSDMRARINHARKTPRHNSPKISSYDCYNYK